MRRITRLPRLGLAFFCLTLSTPPAAGQPPAAATLGHAYCAASASPSGTQYFSAAFSAPLEKAARGLEPLTHASTTWGRAFTDYLTQKHGYTGPPGGCSVGGPSLAGVQNTLTRAIDFTKRRGLKAVETDWVYKSAVPPASAQQAAPSSAVSSGQTPPPPNASAQGNTMHATCWSEFNGPVIYVTQVFDTQMGRPDKGVDVFSPISNEFHQYLKGRYDYKADAARAAHCAGLLSQAQSSAQRSQVITQYGTGKRVVELEWDFSPDTAVVTPGVSQAQDRGYCVTPGTAGTVYMAGPFDLKGRMASFDWNRGFSQFLAAKYAFKGEASCDIGIQRARAQRWFSAHRQGALAGNRKVVDTGWELGAAAAPSSQAAQPNAPNEARPAAPAATPSQEARAFATKEAPETMAYCQNDRALYRGLDCQKVQRLVYNYRIEHAADGTPEPLTTLLEKLDCSSCVDNMRTPAWAKQQAHGSGNVPAVSECVGQRIMAAFLAKPYVNRLMEAYNATLAACKR